MSTLNDTPNPYIQNHVSWCWATAAKIVGFHHLQKLGRTIPVKPKHIITGSQIVGLRREYIGEIEGCVFVDGWQFDIVKAAKTSFLNPTGDKPEGDEGKERALKYVIAGNPDSNEIEVKTLGQCASARTLYQTCAHQLFTIIGCSGCVIGNYQKINGNYHSVVLFESDNKVQLYDPWDGFSCGFTMEQIFQSGFLSNSGPGVIKWIQYVTWQ